MAKIPLYKYFPESDFNTELGVNEISHSSKYDDYTAHRHGYYELFFFRKGGGSHTIDFKELAIKDYSIHAVSPGQVHQLNHNEHCVGKYIVFSTEVIKNILESKYFQQFAFLNNNADPISLQLSNDLFNEIEAMIDKLADHINDSIIAWSWLQLILNYTDREFHKNHKGISSYVKNSDYQRFKQLLEHNYHKQHTVNWYSNQLNLTEKKLNSLTKEITGETLSTLIQQRIFLEAKRLIMHSSSSLKEIAFDLGFNDPAYFSRFIKNNAGLSPKDLRNS
ncbi:MAG: hypothetical protein COA58_10645 [Bacteroidetes bacterium]|nr:MAG: hypothetical protein COA58_10645 [Bacteroidota bacterium]